MNTLVRTLAHGRRGADASRRAPRRHPAAAVAAALVLGAALPALSVAAVPPVDSAGRAAVLKCGTTDTGATVNALHADKIVFVLTGGLQAADPADQPVLNQVPRDTELDIKVIDNPKTIADLRGKVLKFIGAVDNAASRAVLRIISVSYAVVCPAV